MALILISAAFTKPLFAAGEFRVHSTVTLTLEGPTADFIDVIDVKETDASDIDPEEFPSFVSHSHSVDYDEGSKTLTVVNNIDGRGIYTLDVPDSDAAFTGGASRLVVTLGIVNWTGYGWYVDVRVQGEIQVSGRLDDEAEFVETFFQIEFAGNRLDGLTDDPLVDAYRTNSNSPGRGLGYDFVTTTRILNVDEVHSVLIPPSVDVDGGEINITIYDLGLFVQTGGVIVSAIVDGSDFIVLDTESVMASTMTPEILSESDVYVPPIFIDAYFEKMERGKLVCYGDGDHLETVLLGNENFDVSDIDIESIEISGLAVKKVNGKPQCLSADIGDLSFNSEQSSKQDGFDDLVCQFEIKPHLFSDLSDIALLSGTLVDGQRFQSDFFANANGKTELCFGKY
ncbi:MAG: hypothetical protein AAF402_08250 [Pseudomonadota bacterium]